MPKPMKFEGLKPYNIVVNDEDNSAEINMYGEVVETRPIDWWTGEPIPGNFIIQDEFLQDLDKLAGKQNITVHINSVGGSLYVGAAIYNRLKGLDAHITTVNDGLAASAGSLIFEAGDTRKVNAGSNLMIHGAAGFLYGYYQAKDLRTELKRLDAHDKIGINIYVERTGRTKDEIKALVDRETWMTGQDAVDAGFADEVIGSESQPVMMKLTPDRATMMVNGFPVAARCISNIPDTVPVMSAEEFAEMSTPESGGEPHNNGVKPAPQVCDNTHNKGEDFVMEIKNTEDLRKAYPDLVAQVEQAAQANATSAERQRIQNIEQIENAIGDKALVNAAKFGEKPMDAQQLAFTAMQKQAAIGAQMVKDLTDDTKASGAEDVTATPADTGTVTASDDEQAVALLVGAAKN